jgi:hypothetical protein
MTTIYMSTLVTDGDNPDNAGFSSAVQAREIYFIKFHSISLDFYSGTLPDRATAPCEGLHGDLTSPPRW